MPSRKGLAGRTGRARGPGEVVTWLWQSRREAGVDREAGRPWGQWRGLGWGVMDLRYLHSVTLPALGPKSRVSPGGWKGLPAPGQHPHRGLWDPTPPLPTTHGLHPNGTKHRPTQEPPGHQERGTNLAKGWAAWPRGPPSRGQ